jgi:predicted small metal-binding protein
MSMRVFECNVCGEPLTASDDEELLRRLHDHTVGEHPDAVFDEVQAREQLSREAYTASDN